MRGSALDALRRTYLAFTRGTVAAASDQPKMQTIDARLLQNELITAIERFQSYGHTSVPLPPDQGGTAAEVVVAFINGNRSHPIVLAIDDRRHRPKNLKPGESARYDDQKQLLKLGRDGYEATAKNHTITAGSKPDTTFEVNEQLKGLAARVAQAENSIHGLFDVTSNFRAIVQTVIPAVSAVAPILSQTPEGLDAMVGAISSTAQAYMQRQIQQALGKFLSPNLANLQSLLSAGLESSIQSLTSQIAGLVTANPVVATVDDLVQEIADLAASGAPAATIATVTANLEAQIASLTTANPIVTTVAQLRATLQTLTDTAGPALNFLAPQQRLVQGLSKSMKLTGA